MFQARLRLVLPRAVSRGLKRALERHKIYLIYLIKRPLKEFLGLNETRPLSSWYMILYVPLTRAIAVLKNTLKSQTAFQFISVLVVTSNSIQLSPEGEVNSGGYIPRREASRYISTALHRP